MSAYRVRLVLPVVLWGPCELCDEASAPMAGGGENQDLETGRTLATGPAAGTSLPAAGPNLSVPLTEGGEQ